VNLIGEHTDHAGGLALPVAIDRATTVTGRRLRGSDTVTVRSDAEPDAAVVPRTGLDSADAPESPWVRFVAAVVAEVRPAAGFEGTVSSTVPIGAGLSSSAALVVALALALGFEGPSSQLAALAQRAEERATGVRCGLMDQLAAVCGRAGHALLIDFTTLAVEHRPLPAGAEIVVVHSGQERRLAGSAYGDRRAACEARPVGTENGRVRAAAAALAVGEVAEVGRLMVESHMSLRDDFEVSTPALDALVARLSARPGVHGVRLTGAGFGGCVVALTEPGALDEGWVVQAGDGASVRSTTGT
jgi:galactokinase